jgi:hypothetical protein
MRKKPMTTPIEVKAQLGDDVVSREHGQKMRILLERALAYGEPVIVDFAGMQISSVSFSMNPLGRWLSNTGKTC